MRMGFWMSIPMPVRSETRLILRVIEGVRGLYEGFESLSDLGSTAQIAKILNCPVILVINARSITRSSAALVNGYKNFDPDVEIAGVILNNIGSRRHAEKAKEAIEYYTGVPVIGIVPRDPVDANFHAPPRAYAGSRRQKKAWGRRL